MTDERSEVGPHVQVNHLTVRFGENVTALDDVSLTLQHNEFLSVVGPSGCGKSTLLSVIAGLQDPTSGSVSVGGQEIDAPGRDRGVVFQGYTLLPWKNVRENVEFGLLDEKMSARERRSTAMEQLATVGLSDFAEAYPNQLSGGMKQRVAIARSLAYKPRVLLMDEPFGALDALTRRSMQILLTKVWDEHRLTVLFITHDIDEAVYLADRVIVMSPHPGRIASEHTVPLPRPRTREEMFAPEAQELSAKILAEIGDPTTH
ncbi:ABC transporter ATP-binding protein [Brachybacterium sp. AOP42-C2-15]|uniref:ABC transporter ATP-binding protein n=1 Tax=Brachybacterium sp. AOP42-C2-15 TaxID=3457670 RepID=UPI003FDA266A